MTTTTTERSRDAAAPTVHDVRVGLQRTFGDDFDTVWSSVCSSLGVPPDLTSLSADRFDDLLTAVAGQNRLCRVLAMSWRIRCTAARKLAELGR